MNLYIVTDYNVGKVIGVFTKVQNGVSSDSHYYDARGNSTSEIQRINNTDYTLSGKVAANITHLPFGPINQVSYGNGVTEDIAYNTDYSIKQLRVSKNLLDKEYSYYPNGQIKDISNVGSYDYDQLGALTKAESNSYGYDKVSNRTTENVNGSKTDYTIEGTSNRLLSSTFSAITSEYKYDAAGNIIKAKDINYSYDNLNRLKSVTQDSKLSYKQLATYQYNSFSQRTMKDVDGNKTIFIYNSAGQLLEEINKAQNATKDYVYGDGQLIAIAENGQILYIVADHLNAPQIVMDSTGRSIWSAKYNEVGKTTIISNYKLNIRADGQYQDDETGLYYNWHRYYNPDLGRYITSDPLGLEAGMNTYIYVNGNPINATVPMGLAQCEYSISGTTLSCKPNSGGKPISVGPNGIFSGSKKLSDGKTDNECLNNPSAACIKTSDSKTGKYGPIVPGKYKINFDDREEHDGRMFWRLEPNPKKSWLSCYTYDRCGFELHPGSISNGCITVEEGNNNAMRKYIMIDELLNKENGHNNLMVIP